MSAEIATAIARLEGHVKQALELPSVEAEWLSVIGASRLTGLSCDSIRKMISSGIVTGYRPVPGRVLVNREELNEAIRAATHTPEKRRGAKPKQQGGAA